MAQLKGACVIGQSGGPTSVINASAYGVIRTALDCPDITAVYGMAHGIKGMLNDQLYDMGQEDAAELENLLYTPSSALGSCRYKMKDPDVDDTDYKRILEIFKKYNVRYFFYNGGKMPDAVGIPEEQLRKAAESAVCKINIDSDLRLAMTGTVRQFFAEHPDKFDPREYLKPARANIKELVRHKLVNVLGCSGKA